jgi:3-oxoacyl-[acyl-carrier protein] reductase
VSNKQVVFITGAAIGIGRACAQKFLQQGYQVCLCDIDLSKIQLENYSTTDTLSLALDVSDPDSFQTAIDRCEQELGPISICINNAGIIRPSRVISDDASNIDQHIDVNLKGVMYGTSMVARKMKSRNSGHIINLCSMAALAPVPGIGAYSASKYGARAYSLVAAQELKEFGIKVTAVCPDLVNTRMLDQQLEFPEASITFSGAKNALSPERIAEEIYALISNPRMLLAIPGSRAWTARLADIFPQIASRLKKQLEKKGAKRLDEYRREKGLPN